MLPSCNTEAMNLHLAEIATEVTPGAHAVIILDQAGWHLSNRLNVPANITLMPLPSKCPELNPVENVWQTVCSLRAGLLPAETWVSTKVRSKIPARFYTMGMSHAEGIRLLLLVSIRPR